MVAFLGSVGRLSPVFGEIGRLPLIFLRLDIYYVRSQIRVGEMSELTKMRNAINITPCYRRKDEKTGKKDRGNSGPTPVARGFLGAKALCNGAIPKLNFLVSGRISVVMSTFSVFGLSDGRSDNEFCGEEGQNPIFDPLPRNKKLCGNL